MIRFVALLLVAAPLHAGTVLITGARVFDGTGTPARVRDVLIRDNRIVAVRARIKAPTDARLIDARGLTLLPGLHDLHIHTSESIFTTPIAIEQGYAAYLAAGVTTVSNFSVAPEELAGIRLLAESAVVPHQNLAVRLGVPGGHGTESRRTGAITTLVTTPAEARAAMPGLLAVKPDLFKVFADGWRYGDPARSDKPGLDLPTLKAIVSAAHRAKRKVVTHTVSLPGLRLAIDARADAVVHGIGDATIDDATIRRMKARRVAYVATMVVYEPQEVRVLDPRDLAMLRPAERLRETSLRMIPAPIAEWNARRWAVLQDNLRRLQKAGVRIGIGTDAGIAGVYHGWATLREIETYTRLGFTARQALAAATSVSAAIMGRRDVGRIAIGQRADLVLTGGRPDEDIADLYDTRHVFVNGSEIALEAMRKHRAQDLGDEVGGE